MRAVLAVLAAAFLLFVPPALAQPREGFGDLADQLSPAVVNISAAQRMRADASLPTFPPGSPLERFNDLLGDNPRVANSLGSGFIVDARGLVVTNNHVIEEADEVEVVFTDGRTLPADIVGVDPATDLAVLRIRGGGGNFPFVRFGDSDAARVGDWVIAIGNPFGLGGSLTAGVISARGREIGGRYDDYLQTDVAINRGNSGGPLFNMDGQVVGVNTAIFSPTGASVGISFSIPSNIAAPIVRQLAEFGETRRGWLGVNVQAVTADTAEALGLNSPRGAIVSRVDPDGPAYAAGMERGDLILAFNGELVPDDRRLPRMVADTAIGSRVSVDVLRRGEPLTLEVEVQRLDEPDAAPPRPVGSDADTPGITPSSRTVFGLTLAPVTDALRRTHRLHPDARGLVVTAVEPGSDAAGKVRVGDVVEEIAWTQVSTVDEARQIARAAAGETGRPVLFSLNRQGQFILQSLRP
ncbi:serine protease [Glycocaulis albus]|uniref:Probable periplasmic serine endoprotease DegP-like n=1 Tax=Glycocaulis albus TaxID=1382801 RepID=A0ABQ1XSF0_9PROT|nr:Do family serine endopeptidase [Glycocaulis albus]MBV5259449.1 Do family serine endopeptidase [Synechococcus moorigangaii CMS01]GGH02027.1 serine protease [Glycocaulis albus]